MAHTDVLTDTFGVEAQMFKALDQYIETQEASPDSLIEVLHRAHDMFGYLRNDVLEHVDYHGL